LNLSTKRPVLVESASAPIDEKIKEPGDWRGKTLAKVRGIIHDGSNWRVWERTFEPFPMESSSESVLRA